MQKVSLIVPFFNEESILGKNALLIYRYCQKNLPRYEIIFVDDGSTDASYKKVSQITKKLPYVTVVQNNGNMGRGMAIRNGVKKSTGEIIGYIDCDLEIKIAYIPEAIRKLALYDIVIASKFQPDSHIDTPFVRRISSRMYNIITQVILGSKVKDHQAGFKFFRGSLAKKLIGKTKETGWLWDTEVLYLAQKKNYTIYELPITIRYGYRKMRGSFFFDFLKLPFVLMNLKQSLDKKIS